VKPCPIPPQLRTPEPDVAYACQSKDREDGLRHFSQLEKLLQHCSDAAAIGSRVSIAV